MNIAIDPDWVSVSEDEFDETMRRYNYVRDGLADGILYLNANKNGERFGAMMDDGRFLIHKNLMMPAQ